MSIIGKTDDGDLIVKVSAVEAEAMKNAAEALMDLVGAKFPVIARNSSIARRTAPTGIEPAARTPRRSARKPSRAKNDRNKVCDVCRRKFYDDSKTNTRKWCGAGGCKRSGTALHPDDRPKEHGRVLPLHDPAEGG